MKASVLVMTPLFFGCSDISHLLKKDSNQKVLDYVNAHIGKRVGRGVCFDLVRKAQEQKNKNWFKDYWLCGKRNGKSRINLSEVQSGDIVAFYDVIFADSTRIKNHSAVVLSVKDSVLIVAEQNVCAIENTTKIKYFNNSNANVCKDSKVVLDTVDIRGAKGDMVFYHF